jgi:hypothetical protein
MSIHIEQIQEYLRLHPLPEQAPSRQASNKQRSSSEMPLPGPGDKLDVPAYCQHHGVEIDHIEHGKSGETKYILAHCLFDPSHAGKDAAIFQDANGKLGYKCFHSSCSIYGWQEARAKISGDAPLSGGKGERSTKTAAPVTPKKKVSLADYCINNETERLRKEMREAVFIMEGVAIRGQYTAICAPPNGGKTLLTIAGLMKAVREGVIAGSDVFYINVDDNMEGAIVKTEIVKGLGINMIVPALDDPKKNGNTPFDFFKIMEADIEEKTVDGKIIVIDTYKKFINIMDKESQARFNDVMRRFVTLGGSVIALTHVNKNRNLEGKLVWGGTSDLKDDCDAAWIIDYTEGPDGITYEFSFQKGRGHSGENIAFFSPKSTQGSLEEDQRERYRRRLEGIAPQSLREAEELRRKSSAKQRVRDIAAKYHPAVALIMGLLKDGAALTRTEIEQAYKDSDVPHEVPRRKFQDVISVLSGYLWEVTPDGTRKVYRLKEPAAWPI